MVEATLVTACGCKQQLALPLQAGKPPQYWEVALKEKIVTPVTSAFPTKQDVRTRTFRLEQLRVVSFGRWHGIYREVL